MRSSLKPIYLVLGLAGACSLVNKFDPVNDVPAGGGKGGTAGASASGAGGEAGISGSNTTGGTDAGGKGGTSSGGEGGEAGAGNGGTPIKDGLIVVATNTGSGATAKHSLVLLDPATGAQIASTPTTLAVLAVAYESARDKWFVFTGAPGQAGGATGPLLVGTMNSAGFDVEQSVLVAKPTNQNTVAILNQRILYRSAFDTTEDTLTLLDTSAGVKAIGKLTIPYKYSLVSSVGRPASGSTAGGRVFFLHQNFNDQTDNCVSPDAGTEQACSIYYSSLNILATDKNLTLPPATISTVAQLDLDGSFAAMAIQPGASSNTVAIVVPPRRALNTNATIFKYKAGTGTIAPDSPLTFSLDTPGKKIDPTASISIATVALDPCNDLMFAGELANTALLYAVPIGSAAGTLAAFDPQSKNGTVGNAIYEPYSKTLIHFNIDPTNPSFSGFQMTGTPTMPAVTLRGKAGAKPWMIPNGLVPSIVVAKNPDDPPCN